MWRLVPEGLQPLRYPATEEVIGKPEPELRWESARQLRGGSRRVPEAINSFEWEPELGEEPEPEEEPEEELESVSGRSGRAR